MSWRRHSSNASHSNNNNNVNNNNTTSTTMTGLDEQLELEGVSFSEGSIGNNNNKKKMAKKDNKRKKERRRSSGVTGLNTSCTSSSGQGLNQSRNASLYFSSAADKDREAADEHACDVMAGAGAARALCIAAEENQLIASQAGEVGVAAAGGLAGTGRACRDPRAGSRHRGDVAGAQLTLDRGGGGLTENSYEYRDDQEDGEEEEEEDDVADHYYNGQPRNANLPDCVTSSDTLRRNGGGATFKPGHPTTLDRGTLQPLTSGIIQAPPAVSDTSEVSSGYMSLRSGRDANHDGPVKVYNWQEF